MFCCTLMQWSNQDKQINLPTMVSVNCHNTVTQSRPSWEVDESLAYLWGIYLDCSKVARPAFYGGHHSLAGILGCVSGEMELDSRCIQPSCSWWGMRCDLLLPATALTSQSCRTIGAFICEFRSTLPLWCVAFVQVFVIAIEKRKQDTP